MDAEVGVFEPGVPHHREILFQRSHLGKLADVPGFPRRFAASRGGGCRGRTRLVAGLIWHVVEDRLGHLAAGFDLRQHLFGEPAAEGLLEIRHDLHPLQRIEAEFHDIGIEGQVAGPFLGDPPHMLEDRLHDLWGQIPIGTQTPAGFPHGAQAGQSRRGAARSGGGAGWAGSSGGRGGGGCQPADLLFHHLQRAVEEFSLAGVALNLATGCFGDAVGPHQHDRLESNLMLDRQLPTDLIERGGDLIRFPLAALHLRHHHHPLAAIHVDGESRHRAGPHRGAGRFDRVLQILRIVVASADDDQILEPPGHEELAIVEEAEIPGAQVGPGIGLPGFQRLRGRAGIGPREHRAERGGRLGGPVPVALGDARTAHPDLADHPRRKGLARLRIDNPHVLPIEFAAAADESPRAGRGAVARNCSAGFNGGRIEGPHHRRLEFHAAGDHQRALGEAVAGEEGLATEAAGFEGLAEGVDRFGAHRFGAIEGERPTGEVEPPTLLRRDLAHAEFIGEVGTTADRGAVFGNRLQPAQWLLQEGHRRHQHVEASAIERHQDPADEPHVVEARQPKHARLRAGDLKGLHDPQGIVQQVGV